jgi:hypothetical protein
MVIQTDGRIVGDVALPERLTPVEIGCEYILGTQVDELGVVRVRLLRLQR